MNVPSFEFLGFAALAALLINVSAAAGWRRAILLIVNLAFILTFTHDPGRLAPFAALLALGYAGLKIVYHYKAKAAFVALLVLLVLLFCLLKRYTFVPHELFLPFAYFAVGMSYVFFRILHLIIDAYQDALPERVGLLSYVNYTLNFTSLVSGPIQLYRDYHRTETLAPAPLNEAAAARAIERVIVGFFKVAVASPLLFYAHAWALSLAVAHLSLAQRTADGGLILAIFPVFLYINFSGYMDFVIGIARFLRIELPENFNAPFLSQGFIEFWTRWHMTLSNWLKTYVYSPLLLSLMRRFPSQNVAPYLGVFSYFITFFLIGLWHGPTSMFIFFGVLLGLGVSVNKIFEIVLTSRLGRARYRALCAHPAFAALSRGLTFLWFAFSLLWFWSTWGQLHELAASFGAVAFASAVLVLLGAAILLSALQLVEDWLQQLVKRKAPFLSSPYFRTAWCTALGAIVFTATVLLNAPAAHIVYKAF
jgi:D-alanyl-lipoteichoic acid acyltransferase DltB (MBOAT superfamily)